MANTKEYKIVINGITESIEAVKALDKELFNLEQRIKTLEAKSVNIKTGSSGGGGSSRTSNASSLSEEEKLEKQILQTEAKREAYSKEIYQNYLAAKEILAETVKDQKQIAAAERLSAGAYSNTMQGMKQELADIKEVMQTVDLADTGKFDELTKRANELNTALLEIEKSYGQFGRNVGNYKSAVEGFAVAIGDTTAQFDNAKQAAKELDKEMKTLQAKKDNADKGIGIISEEELERLKDLIPVVAQLKSSIEDAGKPMDALMDSMKSFTALASVGKGLSAFFGFDTEIDKSIQKLLALKTAMDGLEEIGKQMQSLEGIGKYFSDGSQNIDKFVAGITNAKIGVDGLTKASKIGTLAVRGLSLALKGIGIGLVIEAINLLVEGVSKLSHMIVDWVKGDADLVKEEKLLEAQLDFVNKKLEERNNELAKSYYQGGITQEEYFRKSLEETTKVINDQIAALKEKAALEGGSFGQNITNGLYKKEVNMSVGGGTREVENLDELTKLWKEYAEAVDDGTDAMSKHAKETGSITDWFKSLIYTLDDTKDDLVQIGQIAIGDFLKKYEHAMQTMAIDTKEGEKELEALKKSMDDNEMLRSIFLNLDQYIPIESFRKRIQQIIDLIRGVKTEMGDMEQRTVQQVLRSEQLKIDAMKEGAAKRQAQRDLDKKKELADATLTAQDKENIEKKYQQRKLKEEKAANQKLKSETDKRNREQLEAEKDLANLRISNMKEGLNKVLKQLEEERRQRLAKLDKNAKDYKKLEEQWNSVYQLKILNAREEWAKKMEELNQKMWNKIASDTESNLKRIADNVQGKTEENRRKLEESYFDKVVSKNRVFSYGVQGSNQLRPTTQFSVGVEATANQSKKMVEMRKLVDLYREMSTAFNQMESAQQQYRRNLKVDTKGMTTEQKQLFDIEKRNMAQNVLDTKLAYDEKAKAYNDYFTELNKVYTKADILLSTNKLREEAYSKDLKTIFNQRYSMVERYWQGRITLETTEAETNYRAQIALLNQQEDREKTENFDNLRENQKQVEEYHRLMIDKIKADGKIKILTEKNVNDMLLEEEKRYEEEKKKIEEQYRVADEEIEKKFNLENVKLQKQREDAVKTVVSNAYEDRLQELRDFQTAVSNLERKQPVVNEWGITNFEETDKINKNLLSSYETMARKVIELKKAVAAEIKDKSLADSIIRELDNFTADIGEKIDDVKQKLSVGEQIGQFISDIQQYIQVLGQGLQTIMNSLWDAQDTQFDNEARQLDKLNEKLQTAMDKNEEILERHKQNVDSIEDELQTARGARREHLIDQLNAEVIAERRAAAEKKKIEKEQEALKKKQDDLDKKRTMAQYQRELTSILVSGALATINAYATKPFVPVGLAMGSLSLGIVAAQYAIAKANPPKFARGGLLEGPSHAQGGIRAGGVELEGNEYVVNKHTTMQNIDLLEYINSNRKKLNISDLIEFYQGDKPRKAIQGVRTRFADGGSLPTLRTDIDVSGGLEDAFKEYAKTPSVVQVVDIVDKTKQYNNVKVLAGLAE